MGSCFVDHTFDATDEATLKKNFANRVEDDCHEHGHGAYSGNLNHGIRVSSQVFKTMDEAQQYVENNTRKWEPALAVKVGDFSKALFNTPKGKKLITQVTELRATVEGFDKELLKNLSTQKSLFKSCIHCGSKISVKHFVKGSSTSCPVCSKEFVKAPKDTEKLKKLYADIMVKEKDLQVMKVEYSKKMGDKKPCWYVGGWAST